MSGRLARHALTGATLTSLALCGLFEVVTASRVRPAPAAGGPPPGRADRPASEWRLAPGPRISEQQAIAAALGHVEEAGEPLLGPNDIRISDMGPDGNINFDALNPAVAYNPTQNEYLVVWAGDDNTPPLVDNEFEIFGQRLSGLGGEIGANDFRISAMGPDGNTGFGAFNHDVAAAPVASTWSSGTATTTRRRWSRTSSKSSASGSPRPARSPPPRRA